MYPSIQYQTRMYDQLLLDTEYIGGLMLPNWRLSE